MNLLVVAASQRPGSQSLAIAREAESLAHAAADCAAVTVIDLSDHRAALWDADAGQDHTDALTSLRDMALACDALVFVVPEWSGMAPPLAKNFFLVMRPLDLAHKPGLIVSVSAGTGGAYPVAELRMGSYKNTKLCWIPDHVIVRGSDFDHDEGETVLPAATRDRLQGAVGMLVHYATALAAVREPINAIGRRWPYGM